MFPNSVISDHDNQLAHLYRAMARVIASLDDEARFYEERGNRWLRNMLLQEGAASFLTFQQNHPAVDYTTYERRTGADLADWLTRVLATVDIVIVDGALPEDMIRWIGELTRPHLHTFLIDPGGSLIGDADSIGHAALYSGICIADPDDDLTLESSHAGQHVVRIQPALPAPGANGIAQEHVERAAISLVAEIAQIVDESLLRSNEPQ